MNTVAFARMLGRHLAVENPSRLGGDAALDVIAAMNAGLQLFYAEAPARLKQQTISRVVRSPQGVAITVTAQYAKTLAAPAFAVEQAGCTVRFGSGPDNEVAGEAELFDAHISPLLSGQATVYCDALPIAAPVERLMSDVRIYGSGWHRSLVRDDRLRDRRAEHTEGEPAFYQFEERAVSQGGAPAQILRLWPLPAGDYLLRFEAECSPERITFAHLATPTEIPIPDRMAEDILLPLCLRALSVSPLWADAGSISRIEAAATEAAARKIPGIAHDAGIPNNTVGTKEGF